ncbi:MAG: NAD(P)H-quinone oxidoreductase [Clostridiales bacterium]|nr:NAD(P)H-quinone oxidoreductase [Clostridiales bacterium]
MKAMLVCPDQSLEWREVGEPVLHDGEVLIDIKCAACNRADILQRAGKYPSPVGCPEWMGLEVAGVVAETRSEKYKVGDRVCALLGGGGYAERVAVNAGMALPIPAGLSFEAAAAIPETFATAYLNLVSEAKIKAGDTVLIMAGASGLGTAAIQVAKHFGARVITTVGSDDKIEPLKKLGADIVVNRKTGDLGAIMDANPVDIALDCAAGSSFGENFLRMNHGGRWIIISTLAGEVSEINLRGVMKKGLRLIGSTLRSREPEEKYCILDSMRESLWGGFESGELAPVIYKVLPICEAERAHDIMNGDHVGKVVLMV